MSIGRCLALVGILLGASGQAGRAQAPRYPRPPRPYADSGVCPFEGCVYRDWVAKERVLVRAARDTLAPVTFTLARGQRVQAMTGIVVTLAPGLVRFAKATTFPMSGDGDSVWKILPSDTLFLLTYQGEGFSKVWFRGQLYSDVDIAHLQPEDCLPDLRRCGLALLVPPRTDWWAKLRDAKGREGWALVRNNFTHIDALAGDHTP